MILRSPFRVRKLRRKAKYPENTWHPCFIIWPRRMQDDNTVRCFETVGRTFHYSSSNPLRVYAKGYASLSHLATKKLLNE